jgi:hypothetical protein
MRKYAAATALVIALNITITPAVSADCFPVRSTLPGSEGECDRSDGGAHMPFVVIAASSAGGSTNIR